MGTAFMPAMSLATIGVKPQDAGVASAMVNTSQQVGGAIGTALLNTIAASATTAYVADHIAAAGSAERAQQLVRLQGMVDGYTTAIWWAVGGLLLSAAIAFVLVDTRGRNGTPVASGGPDEKGESDGEPVLAALH